MEPCPRQERAMASILARFAEVLLTSPTAHLLSVFCFRSASIPMKSSIFSKRLLALASTAVLCCAAVMTATAQNAALGNISGVVRDSAGAVIPNATVVVTNTATGASRTVTTNGDGYYSATFLQPGVYEVILGGGSLRQGGSEERQRHRGDQRERRCDASQCKCLYGCDGLGPRLP